jgi:hypothetical protein
VVQVACALLLALAEVQVGARAEVQGGQAPLLAGQASESTARSTLQPEAGLALRWRLGQSRLHYGPRLTYRAPNPAGTDDALVMHLLGAEHESRLARGVRAFGEASSSFGDVDYATLSQSLEQSQSTLPAVTRLWTIGGGAAVEVRAIRRWTLQTRLGATHQRPLDDGATAPAAGATLSRSTNVELSETARHALTRRDDLTLRLGASDQRLSSGLHVLAIEPGVGWQRRLSRAQTLELGGGVVVVHALGLPAGAGAPEVVSPVATAALGSRHRPGRGLLVDTSVSLGATWFLDPVLVTGLTRGVASASISATYRTNLTVAASAQVATTVSRAPLPGEPDETLVRAELPVRYRVSPHLAVEVGGRYSDRGRHLLASELGMHQRELWLYAQLVASASTRVH